MEESTRKKYILTKEHKILNDQTRVSRIQAIISFGDVKAGDLGGFVEYEDNLSHNGDCWLYDEAIACHSARVSQYAKLRNQCQARDHALIFNDAELSKNVIVDREAQIYGKAKLSGLIVVSDYVWICGDAVIQESKRFTGRKIIDGVVESNDVRLPLFEQ